MERKWIKNIGSVITILSLLFIARIVMNFDINFEILFNFKITMSILLLSLLFSFSVILDSLAWKILLEMLSGSKVNTFEVVYVYAKANLGKYLPGNFMHFASRNIIGKKYSFSQKDMVLSTVLEIVLKIFGVLLLIFFLVRNQLVNVLEQLGGKTYLDIKVLIWISVLFFIIVTVIFLYKKKELISEKLKVKELLFALNLYVSVFMLSAIVFIVVAIIISENAMDKGLIYMSGIYLISWLLGYLTPGSPGGVGIRETVIILMLSNILAMQEIVLISVIIRIITIMADLIAYFVNIILERKVDKKDETYNSNSLL